MNEKNNLKYIIYARKSSEDKDKQVQSIDAQLRVLNNKAKAEKLTVVATIDESKSAKAPFVRNKFYEMMSMIENGEADAILCWHINRLSRNPTDNGQIQQMLQDYKIREIRTFDRKYKSDDSAYVFSVESTAGNEFIRELRKNVKRGMAEKIVNGGLPGVAPEGYVNNRIDKTIEVDPVRFPLVRKAFDMFLSGDYTVIQILNAMNNDWGYTTIQRKKMGGGPIARSSLYKIFTNPRYAGLIPDPNVEGKFHRANYTPMITRDEFDRIQQMLDARNRPRYLTKRYFELRGLVKCGECGCAVTAERKSKKLIGGGVNLHTYYHCTHKKPCSQKGVTESELYEQVNGLLDEYELTPKLYDWGIQALNEMASEEVDERNDVQKMQNISISKKQNALDTLLKKLAEGVITDEAYQSMSEIYRAELTALQKQQTETSKRVRNWYEIIGKTLEELTNANEKFASGDFAEKANILKAIGQNPILIDKKVQITPNEWLIPLQRELPAMKAELSKVRTNNSINKNESPLDREQSLMSHWYTRQDSNLRPSVPKTDALIH
jgi:site-specific DNA recombinase